MKNEVYFHFCGKHLRDGRLRPPIGEKLDTWKRGEKFVSDYEVCSHGLHVASNILDALKYMPHQESVVLCGVTVGDILEKLNDKIVVSSRTIAWELTPEETIELIKRSIFAFAMDAYKNTRVPNTVSNFMVTYYKKYGILENAQSSADVAEGIARIGRTGDTKGLLQLRQEKLLRCGVASILEKKGMQNVFCDD